MNLEEEVDREPLRLQRLTTARRSSCPCFADLMGWGEAILDPMEIFQNPGVMFETARRVLVFQEIAGELRYYAGGWRSSEERVHLDSERIEAEGFERGVLDNVAAALALAEHYLVEQMPLQDIQVPRRIVGGMNTHPEA